jgi:hypothetical protein
VPGAPTMRSRVSCTRSSCESGRCPGSASGGASARQPAANASADRSNVFLPSGIGSWRDNAVSSCRTGLTQPRQSSWH